ncbi:MAG: diphosphomevalonate decarboxylase, partial [Litorilinea sp.]
ASSNWSINCPYEHPMSKCTIRAGSNIAFIKYWGVADAAINLPLNSSISMTLADAHTTTTVEWLADAATKTGHATDRDTIEINGAPASEKVYTRTVAHLDRIRTATQTTHRARIASVNNFPLGAGIASSASGFAALTVAAVAALDTELVEELDAVALNALTRQGSGSACRSLFGGFVLWDQGTDSASSLARQLYPPDYWDLYDIVAVVDTGEKRVSSEGGHRIAHTSPLNAARVDAAQASLPQVHAAIIERNLAALGPLIERDALAMHAVMMTGAPSLMYWQPGTLSVIQAVLHWRAQDDIPVYFTIDAGPNVHLICEAGAVSEVNQRLQALDGVRETLVSRAGPGPQTLTEHLF